MLQWPLPQQGEASEPSAHLCSVTVGSEPLEPTAEQHSAAMYAMRLGRIKRNLSCIFRVLYQVLSAEKVEVMGFVREKTEIANLPKRIM